MSTSTEISNNVVNVYGCGGRVQFGHNVGGQPPGPSINSVLPSVVPENTQPTWRTVSHWLFAPNSIFDQRAFHDSAQGKRKEVGTGSWFFDGPQSIFSKWLHNQGSFLWLNGTMGCGKTILCSTVIEKLVEECANETTVVLYHYFTFTDKRSQVNETLLKSLVFQLARKSSRSQQILIDAYHEANNGDGIFYCFELKKLLQRLLKLSKAVFIVIDALDECIERGEVFDFLEEIRKWDIPEVRVLISSKTMEEIEEAIVSLSAQKVHIQSSVVDNDIRKHINFQLLNNRDFREWDAENRAKIENALSRSSEGIFQYIVAPLAEISECLTQENLDKALDSLPKSLNDTYERALCSVEKGSSKNTLKVLLNWLLCSSRPLRLEELAEVIISEVPYPRTKKRLQLPKKIFDLCGGLVTVDMKPNLTQEEVKSRMFAFDEGIPGSVDSNILHDKSTIRFAHSSVIEYLTGDEISKSPAREYKLTLSAGHRLLAEASLAYIIYFNLHTMKPKSKEAQIAFPLLEYAIDFWFDHSRTIEHDQRVKLDNLISEVLKSRWDVYRHLTFLSTVPRYDTWPLRETIPCGQNSQQNTLCQRCSTITLEELRDDGGFLHGTFDQLKRESTRCGLCILIHEALAHYAAMKSLQNKTQETVYKNRFTDELILQAQEIASICGSQRIRLVAERDDPFVLVRISCYFGRLHLFAPPGGELSALIPGRPVNKNLSSQMDFQQISTWLRDCVANHPTCELAMGGSEINVLPTRLLQVDCKDSLVRLIDRDGIARNVTYATHTPCWLTGRLLQTGNIVSKLRSGIEIARLPRTFQDAIVITRALGISYIWIDLLCLIVDSAEDRKREIPRMTKYYANAVINLDPGTEDLDSGILTSKRGSKVPTVILQQSHEQFGIGWLGTEAFSDASGDSFNNFPDRWRYRAINFGPLKFIRRNLVFQPDQVLSNNGQTSTSAQIYMECWQRIIWENGRQRDLKEALAKDDHGHWCDLVEGYSSRSTLHHNPSEYLFHFSILAIDYAKRMGDRNVAGLSCKSLLRGLLWKRAPIEQRKTRLHTSQFRVPSWSWASVLGRIEYPWAMDTTVEARVIDCPTTSMDPVLAMEPVPITLQGFAHSFLLPKQDIYHDEKPVDVKEESKDGSLNFRCWMDFPSDLGDGDLQVMGFQITKRVALILVPASEDTDNFTFFRRAFRPVFFKRISGFFRGKFFRRTYMRRIGIMIIAKTDVNKWNLVSEKMEVVIV